MNTYKPCIVIPVYNHPHAIIDTVNQLQPYPLPCILVNDGSDEECSAVLENIARETAGIILIKRNNNGGKGAAVKTGLRHAYSAGFSHALQIDADGQHNQADIPVLLNLSKANPSALISGQPEYDESVPRLRFYARYLTHIWVWINTLSLEIKDSMCGFRAYPLKETVALLDQQKTGNRMDFDPEIMVRLHRQGMTIKHFRTRVQYPSDGISHFNHIRDNLLISRMHATLFFGMLIRLPTLLKRKL